VRDERDVETGCTAARLDDKRTEKPAPDLFRGRLVCVVPERPNLSWPEAVDVPLPRKDGVLRDSRNTVVRVWNVDAVPVDRDAPGDVPVH
jgi:hypothetical protein